MKKFDLIKNFIHSVENDEIKEKEEVSICGIVCNKYVGKVPSQPYTSVTIMYGNYNVYCALDSYRFKEHFKPNEIDLIGKFNEANSNLKIGKKVEVVGTIRTSAYNDGMVVLDIKEVNKL